LKNGLLLQKETVPHALQDLIELFTVILTCIEIKPIICYVFKNQFSAMGLGSNSPIA